MAGRAKVVKYFNNRYQGALSDQHCEVLEEIIDVDRSHGSFSDFKHMIYTMSDSDVTTFIEDMEQFGTEMHSVDIKYGTLEDYQTVGVAFLVTSRRCILGDSVGLGKTVEVAGAINYIRSLYDAAGKEMRFLALTQKNLVHQFRSEMVKFTGSFVQLVESGEQKIVSIFEASNPYQDDLAYSVVGTHALLTTPTFIKWLEQCRTLGKGFPFDTLIIDESSVLGGNATQIVNGYKAIAKYFKNIFFLNATPFETQLQVFYNQFALLDDSYLPTKTNFTKEYCVMDYRGMFPRPTGRYKNQKQFKELVAYRYMARTRREQGVTLEGCDGKVVLSSLSPIQREWLKKSQLRRMVYDCPTYIDPTIEFNSENVPKLGSLNSLFENEMANADTVIIFSHFKEAQKYLSEWLTKKGISNRVLNGATKDADRQDIIDGFKQGMYRVLITNVQKGLNFGSCDYCVFYSFDPNPSRMIQFEGRITRSLSIEGKHVYILCSRGQEYKTLNEVVRQRAKATTEFTNADISLVMSILLDSME